MKSVKKKKEEAVGKGPQRLILDVLFVKHTDREVFYTGSEMVLTGNKAASVAVFDRVQLTLLIFAPTAEAKWKSLDKHFGARQ